MPITVWVLHYLVYSSLINFMNSVNNKSVL